MVVDPARQFASPYNGMGNNPINGVDPDGEWVWMHYMEANLYGGIIKGWVSSYQWGTAYDDAGKIAYNIEVHGLAKPEFGEVSFGADIGGDIGVGVDYGSKTFDEFIRKSPLAVGLAAIDVKATDEFIALEWGVSVAAGFSRLTDGAVVKYFGYTQEDYAEVTGSSFGGFNSKKWHVREVEGRFYLNYKPSGLKKWVQSNLELFRQSDGGWHTRRYNENYQEVHATE